MHFHPFQLVKQVHEGVRGKASYQGFYKTLDLEKAQRPRLAEGRQFAELA